LLFEEVVEGTEALVDGVVLDDLEIIWREIHAKVPTTGERKQERKVVRVPSSA